MTWITNSTQIGKTTSFMRLMNKTKMNKSRNNK